MESFVPLTLLCPLVRLGEVQGYFRLTFAQALGNVEI